MNNESFENLEGGQNSGTFTHTFSNISSLSDTIRFSDAFHVGRVPWRLCIRTENSARTDNEKYFGVYSNCNWEDSSRLWSCKAECEIRVWSSSEKKNWSKKFTDVFDRKTATWGLMRFIKFEDLMNPENGYVKEDKIKIELNIRIETINGFHKVQLFDFETPNSRFFDGTITIKNRKLYVGKMYLSMCSSYFNAMFEKNSDLVLNGVDPDEFLNVLHLIHSSDRKINVENIDYSLKLCKKFDIPMLMQKCSDFLISQDSSEYPILKKLENAYTYKLPKLQACCFERLKKVEDVIQLTKLKEFDDSSDGVRLLLFERMLEVHKK